MLVTEFRYRVRFAVAAAVLAAGCNQSRPVPAPPAHAAGPTSALAEPIVFPAGPEGDAARRGLAILSATRDSMPEYVGANLRCFSCHLDQGTRPNAVPLVGAYVRYPAYASRDDRIISIQDRVNNCFRRSMSGRVVPVDDERMNAVVMYLAVMSRGVSVGSHVTGEGMPSMALIAVDTSRGSDVFRSRCARCHGMDGQGIPPATPLWGARSYSIGASLARRARLATFIRHNMPYDSAGVLSDQQSFDVAAYILSHPRPDSPEKQGDWASGGAPADVPYNTRGHSAFDPPRVLPAAMR